MYVLINGNPSDGFVFTGPFQTHDEALEFAEWSNFDSSWWISELENPVEVKEDTMWAEASAHAS